MKISVKHLVSIDQYIHSATTFGVPLVVAIYLTQKQFESLTAFLILVSLFLGLLNSTAIYFNTYKSNSSNFWLRVVLLLYACICLSIYIYAINKDQNLNILPYTIYGALLLATEYIRKHFYTNSPDKIKPFLAFRLLSIVLSYIVSKFNIDYGISMVFLGTSLQLLTAGSNRQNSEVKIIKLEDLKQAGLFVYSFTLSHIAVLMVSIIGEPNEFSKARIVQLLFSGGAFILLPLEPIVIRKLGLNRRDKFSDLNEEIPFSFLQVFFYLIVALIANLLIVAAIPWMDFNGFVLAMQLICWYSAIEISRASIRLKAGNRASRQMKATTVTASLGIAFILMAVQMNLSFDAQLYAAHLAISALVTRKILRGNVNAK